MDRANLVDAVTDGLYRVLGPLGFDVTVAWREMHRALEAATRIKIRRKGFDDELVGWTHWLTKRDLVTDKDNVDLVSHFIDRVIRNTLDCYVDEVCGKSMPQPPEVDWRPTHVLPEDYYA